MGCQTGGDGQEECIFSLSRISCVRVAAGGRVKTIACWSHCWYDKAARVAREVGNEGEEVQGVRMREEEVRGMTGRGRLVVRERLRGRGRGGSDVHGKG